MVAYVSVLSSRSVVTAGMAIALGPAFWITGSSAFRRAVGGGGRVPGVALGLRGGLLAGAAWLLGWWDVAEEFDGLGPCVCPCGLIGGVVGQGGRKQLPG